MKYRLPTIWFWSSQLVAVIGLVGIVEDLRAWFQIATWTIDQIDFASPSLARLLEKIGGDIHDGLEILRGVYRPIFVFLLGWLPFEIPWLAIDLLFVVAFIVLGNLKVNRWFAYIYEKNTEYYPVLWKEMCSEAKIAVSSRNNPGFYSEEASSLMKAIELHRELIQLIRSYKRSIDINRIKEICENEQYSYNLKKYGVDFLNNYASKFVPISEIDKREVFAIILVFVISGFVIVFLIVDFIWFT